MDRRLTASRCNTAAGALVCDPGAAPRRLSRFPALVPHGLVLVLLGLAGLGWVIADARMAGTEESPSTDLGALGFYVTAWVVMLAAMMLPSIAPVVVMYSRLHEGGRERGQGARARATAAFLAGYLVAWTAVGLAFYAVMEVGRALDIEALAWNEAGPYVAGGVILAAALYQLTPLKDACLSGCRSPFMFLLQTWRLGRFGALRMGVEYGGRCVGCCWALMASRFALGVMSVGWMAFVAALIALEKLLPWKAVANHGVAVLLAALGLAVAIAPEYVPGLTVPGSSGTSAATQTMP